MNAVGFWVPIIYESPRTWGRFIGNVIEEAFYFGGIKVYLTPPTYANAMIREESEPVWRIALKATVLVALTLKKSYLLLSILTIKLIYRSTLGFKIADDKKTAVSTRIKSPQDDEWFKQETQKMGAALKSTLTEHEAKIKISYHSKVRKYLFSLKADKSVKIQEVVKTLGRGGFGKVYELIDQATGEHTALKVAKPPKNYKHNAEYLTEADQDLDKEFFNLNLLNPVGVIAGIQTPPLGPLLTITKLDVSPSKISVTKNKKTRKAYEANIYHGNLDSLKVHILPLITRIKIIYQVVMGVQHYLNKGLVHSDLKPANILYIKEGNHYKAHISDFGSAWSKDDSREGLVYTPHYVTDKDVRHINTAWTQGGKHRSGKKLDIYSLGKTIYELLTGREPSKNGNDDLILERAALKKEQHAKFIDILKRMIVPDPGGVVTDTINRFINNTAVVRPAIGEVVAAVESCL